MELYPEKRAVLSRRASKLLEWLQRDEYAVYKNEESITRLVKQGSDHLGFAAQHPLQ